ncbi:TlpA disulfide reductase family protein [Tenacibaculum retecalamus]|uniref:TlpA disulfide reductase family protein n=1 Tax=Tenacibaculum retecalamus TaxID=3018315 RepID=UPI0023D910F3|nr:TlpA disulfide reductase family protein [Tenacibaculum retecalamus]WBX72257.1 TlpA disulfide reductase family protein [Tenacibaculum retecalamus]
MNKIILALITLMIVSCNKENKNQFSLKGKTKDIKNETVLYLDLGNKTIDSTLVIDNSFVFKTKLSDYPLQLILRTKNFSQFRPFWAGNNSMTFDAIETDFRNAKISGSEDENLSFNLSQKIDQLSYNESQKIEMAFVENNPNSIVSASMLSVYATTWGKEKVEKLFEQFSNNNRNSKFGKKITRYIELNKDPKVGDSFPDFEMQNINGKFKKLSEVKEKLILLEFWASWCDPCLKENPNLVKTYKKFNSKGFEIFAVSLDENKKSWIQAIEKDSLNWEHVTDLKGQQNKASLIYGVNAIPDNFLINEEGKIVGRNLRGEKLNEKIKELLE